MEWKNLIYKKDEGVAVITINRPTVLNALDSELLDELNHCICEVETDESINVVIITGEGKAFVAGADIREMSALNSVEIRPFAEKALNTFRKLELMEKPVIAAVNGFALGGGCELSMACDIRIASKKAKFGQPETGLGITPGFGGTQRLPRLVGTGIAKELIFTGAMIDGEEAYRIGLANKVVEPEALMETAMALAKEISSRAQLAVRYSKTAINRGIETDIETGMLIEKDLFALCFATQDQKEGMVAFIEKRKPNYNTK